MSDSVAERELILAIPITLLSVFSLVAALYICVSVCMMRKVNKQLGGLQSNEDEYNTETYWEKPMLITHHIFWMSFFDTLLAFAQICLWGPKIFGFKLFQTSSVSCSIGGAFVQFAALGSVVWYFVVAWCLFITVFGIQNHDFGKLVRYHSIAAWSVIVLICMIPVFDDQYGANDNLRNLDSECWVKDPSYYLILYIPVVITISFALFLLISVWVKFYPCKKRHSNNNNNSNNNSDYNLNYKISDSDKFGYSNNRFNNIKLTGISIQDTLIVKRLSLFTIVYVLVWIPPLSDRLYSVFNDNKNAPFWMTVCHHCGLGLIGMGNAFIWSKSQQFHSFAESYQLMSHAKREKDVIQFRDQLWNDASL